ncbi:MAG: hypothetical protein V7640_1637 [Betaproteobacteria bacterium]
MPRALNAGHELNDCAISPDQEMRRNAKPGDASVIRMMRWVELIEEQRFNSAASKLTGGKTDRVNDDDVDHRVRRPIIAVRRRHERHAVGETFGADAYAVRRLSFSRQARL